MDGPTTPWRMPAEWTPHERTWMAWPSHGYTLGDTPEEVESALTAFAEVPRLLIASDFDGVIAPIVSDRDAVQPDAAALALAGMGSGGTAMCSGHCRRGIIRLRRGATASLGAGTAGTSRWANRPAGCIGTPAANNWPSVWCS